MVVLALLTRKWIFGASWTTYLIVGIKMYRRYRLEASGRSRQFSLRVPLETKREDRASPRPGYFVTRNRCSQVDF